jgi:transketolase
VIKNKTKIPVEKKETLKSTRDGFGQGMVELAEKNSQVVALCADLTESLRLNKFAEKYPERFIQVGIAEQNMIGVAAGLAIRGKIPFAASFAVFSPGRTWEQIRDSVCYSDLPVIIVGGHTGLNVGEDGYTQQGLEDLALMRVLPNMTIVSPVDFEETRKAVHALSVLGKPAYLRLTRKKSLSITDKNTPFEIGKANVIKNGNDITIIGSGPILAEAIKATKNIDNSISIEIINLHTIKPLDISTIIKSLQKTKAFITIEEHQLMGGVYSAILESLANDKNGGKLVALPHKALGLKDSFGESGKAVELWKKHNLDSSSIEKTIQTVLEWKND